ncbi:hypothetical protein EVAR_16304_1 [Eumeta japonica]|uniref:Uncharacterized protein n=1 Tax=Eumeta variegata TaxID=151549 RepID=A0A4C1VFI2_EUMVA|nr:hypothetical protein EVAR_16304_1 [Eumeta japonica]
MAEGERQQNAGGTNAAPQHRKGHSSFVPRDEHSPSIFQHRDAVNSRPRDASQTPRNGVKYVSVEYRALGAWRSAPSTVAY